MFQTLTSVGIKILIGIVLLNIIFAFIPPIPLPTDVKTAIEWAAQLVVNLDFVLPVSTIFTIITIMFSAELILLTIKAINFLKSFIIE